MRMILIIGAFAAGWMIGGHIRYEVAKTKYHGAQQEADWRYGCSIKQQMPNGDCP